MVTLWSGLLRHPSRLGHVTLTSNREIPGLARCTHHYIAIVFLSLHNWSMIHTYGVEHLSVRRMLDLSHAWRISLRNRSRRRIACIDGLRCGVPHIASPAARVLDRLTLDARIFAVDRLRPLVGVRQGAHLCTRHLRVRLHLFSPLLGARKC